MRIRCGLSSRHLSCGCLVGLYETYRGDVIAIVDVRAPECHNPEHVKGKALPGLPAPNAHLPK
jgi:hypothetical protein